MLSLRRMRPRPVAVDEQLKLPIYACKLLCRLCRTSLLYQRQERPRFPGHFFFCPRCGRRYAAGERWSPEAPAAS